MGGSPYGFELCSLIDAEVCEVAKAEGVDAQYESVIKTFQKVIDPNESGNHVTSMLQDVLKMKPTDIYSITGVVIEKAAHHGISTPHLKTVFNLIKVIEENYNSMLFSLEDLH
jgi:2-dehydropantoate 2-reductase